MIPVAGHGFFSKPWSECNFFRLVSSTEKTADEILRGLVTKSVHDMRSPLSCIGTALEILRLSPSGTADHERMLEQIRGQLEELSRLLKSLSDAAVFPAENFREGESWDGSGH